MPLKVVVRNPELDVTQLLQFRPANNYSGEFEAMAQSDDGSGVIARILVYVDSNKYRNLRRVYRANLQTRVLTVDSGFGNQLEAYLVPLSGNAIKTPSWNQANSTTLWIGGSTIASTKTSTFLGTAINPTWFNINLIRQTRRAAERKNLWPPCYLLRWDDESGVINALGIAIASDNYNFVNERTSLQLTIGIQPMRNRPSGMYRGFRRS